MLGGKGLFREEGKRERREITVKKQRGMEEGCLYRVRFSFFEGIQFGVKLDRFL